MSWAVGYDVRWERWVGYGVPAWCDHPGCYKRIDRGLANICCNQEPHGGDEGCGLFFCEEHHSYDNGKCERCARKMSPFQPSSDTDEWIEHMATHPSWAEWRAEQQK